MAGERTRFHDLIRLWTHGEPEHGLPHRITVGQLADAAGVDYGTARDWSEGRSMPTLRTYTALVRGLPLHLAAELAAVVHAACPIETAFRGSRPRTDFNGDGRVTGMDAVVIAGKARDLRGLCDSLIAITDSLVRHRITPAATPAAG
jgi:hypothetical protein